MEVKRSSSQVGEPGGFYYGRAASAQCPGLVVLGLARRPRESWQQCSRGCAELLLRSLLRVADDLVQHVFVSYVREDSEAVDRLCEVLTAAGIPYWTDRTSLAPGDAWKAKIREAIRSGSLVFLACFSDNSRAKAKSYMNEELTLAVEEFRQVPPGRTWLIPVHLDDGPIPEWDLGAGRTFDDINYVDFFGQQVPAQSASLAITISHIVGNQGSEPVVARAAASDSAETIGLSSRVQDPAQERPLPQYETLRVSK